MFKAIVYQHHKLMRLLRRVLEKSVLYIYDLVWTIKLVIVGFVYALLVKQTMKISFLVL